MSRDDEMSETRKHPDVFTAEEAVEYLHLDSEQTLRTLRDRFGLVGIPFFGKELRYLRKDLDALVARASAVSSSPNAMRMAK
jgi:hypothetical protein